jgi:hypothetical protein
MEASVTIIEFLSARLDEDEAVARAASPGPWHTNAEAHEVLAVDDITVAEGFALSGPQTRATTEHIARHDPARVLAEVEAKRKIIAFHDQWPVLVQTEPKIEFSGSDTLGATIDQYAVRMSQQIDWQTTQQYRARFGTEPPTAPMLRALVQVYSGHPDFEEEWRL